MIGPSGERTTPPPTSSPVKTPICQYQQKPELHCIGRVIILAKLGYWSYFCTNKSNNIGYIGIPGMATAHDAFP